MIANVTTRNEHSSKKSARLDESKIDPDALEIVRILQNKGHTTFLVGGCVRDVLLGKHPKDYDIATLALPQDVKRLIRNAFIIGRRFRLVLVKRGDRQFEVATFRRDAGPEDKTEEMPAGDNLFGTPEDDAKRRDFTINALFYDPGTGDLIDFAGGLHDLKAGVIKMIGDANVRLIEDPIRIMRGIRLAHMIRFALDPYLRSMMQKHAASLTQTVLPRRREEILKYLRLDNPALPFLTSLDLGVLDYVSPTLAELMRDTSRSETFLSYLFAFHDKHLETPAELFAGLVSAYVLSLHHGTLPENLRTHDILDNEKIVKLMRDELGMFKSEQTTVARALHLMTLLNRRGEYEKRGDRRRRSLIANEAFDLALKISEREHWLSANELQYWRKEHTRFIQMGGDDEHSERGHGPRGARNNRKRRKRRDEHHGRSSGRSHAPRKGENSDDGNHGGESLH